MTDLIAEPLFEDCYQPGIALSRTDQSASEAVTIGLLARPRLAFSHFVEPIAVVCAPAGYGKSCLLEQWRNQLQSERRSALLIQVSAGGRLAAQDLSGERWDHTHNDIVALIDNWIGISRSAVVLIDDGHLLSPRLQRTVFERFLSAPRAGYRLVFVGRQRPALPLARPRALRLVKEIDAETLAFREEDVRAIARENGAGALTDEQLRHLTAITEGWPVALSLCLPHVPDDGGLLPDAQTASTLLHDFFVEEIIDQLPADLRAFLFAVSGLPWLHSGLCDAVLERTDSDDLLENIARHGLIAATKARPAGHLRLNDLFARVLRMLAPRRAPAAQRQAAERAIEWLEARGLVREAFDHAIDIKAWDRSAALLDRHALAAYTAGRSQDVMAMALRIPADILQRYPQAMIYAARAAASGWQFGVVENLHARLAKHVDAARKDADDGPVDLDHLVLHSRMLLCQFEDNQAEAERLCIDLLGRPTGFDHYTRGTIYGSLLYARRELFRLTDVAELEAAGVREFSHLEVHSGLVWHLCAAGPTRAMMGDLDAAAGRLEEAMAVARAAQVNPWLIDAPAALLAEIRYERNDLAGSRALLDAHFPRVFRGFVDPYIAAYITDARLKYAAGGADAAFARLNEAMGMARTYSLERLRQHVVAEQIRLMLAGGQPDEAARLAEREGHAVPAESVLPRASATTRDEVRARSWVRLALAKGATADAVRVARRWLRHLSEARALNLVVRWEILMARALAAYGDDAQASRALRAALVHAAPSGQMRSFLDEGDAVRGLLERQFAASPMIIGEADRFLARLIGAEAEAKPQTPAERKPMTGAKAGAMTGRITGAASPLSKQQCAILQMASGGMRNAEIGRRIGMTEGSVKWHLQQIYDCIGVRRRAGALERARELGLIA
ncbi:MAG TPA: LuxR C-terminal-related transcriptional regulator [Pseudolabrys sp.]|nr:LuxR C-terminal-related transcriptional regulator [Pseudolabrys sp.]